MSIVLPHFYMAVKAWWHSTGPVQATPSQAFRPAARRAGFFCWHGGGFSMRQCRFVM